MPQFRPKRLPRQTAATGLSLGFLLSAIACGDDAVSTGAGGGNASSGNVASGTSGDASSTSSGMMGDRPLLTPSDFSYLGHYTFGSGDTTYGTGLTHRYVDGKLRLMYCDFVGAGRPAGGSPYVPTEIELPTAFGDSATTIRSWGTMFSPTQNFNARDIWLGITWDEKNQRLWSSSAFDYPQGTVTTEETLVLASRKLPDGGQDATDHQGFWGFAGIGQRAIYGGVQSVPDWFQKSHGVGALVTGWGGYTSRMDQGLGASLGPMMVFFDDPHGNVPGAPFLDPPNLAESTFKIGADTRSGTTGNDWYAGGYAARTFDRGCRTTACENYFDGGDPRQNPQTPPTDAPLANASWLHPVPGDPDGAQRWVWGDTYSNNVQWIDSDPANGTTGKHGIVAILDGAEGKAFYMTSALHYSGRLYEMHIYDPSDVAEILAGNRPAWSLRPTSMARLTLPGKGAPEQSDQQGGIRGVTFDETTGRLYLAGYWDSTQPPQSRIYVFELAK
jgi:hypothetical protein